MSPLADYEEVPDRIRRFFEKYPDGSLGCQRIEYKTLPVDRRDAEGNLHRLESLHVIYHAIARRTPDDKAPGYGCASEPIPGLTNYTRDSELMNAETSAWGRALVALGFVAKKVASANEVRAREGASEYGKVSGRPMASEAQVKLIKRLTDQKKVDDVQGDLIYAQLGIPKGTAWSKLTGGKDGQASALITFLKENPIPTGSSDVPADTGDFATHDVDLVDDQEPLPFDEKPKRSHRAGDAELLPRPEGS